MERQLTIRKELTGMRRSCRHYWIIEEATGPVSKGRCKFCGAEKDFKNLLQDCLMTPGDSDFEQPSLRTYPEDEQMILAEIEQVLRLAHV